MADGQSSSLTAPAKLLLLASLLAKDGVITNNGKAFLKELILQKDPRLMELLERFDSQEGQDTAFLDTINDLIEGEAEKLFDSLYNECTLEKAKSLSKAEREVKSMDEEKSLIYGEVEFHSFARVLRKIGPRPGTKFYDLGSGTGRAVFIARFLHDFDRCVGLEILEGLHGAAAQVLERYNQHYRQYLSTGNSQRVAVYQGSILEQDWSDGDLVFANSTCFDDDLMEQMSKQAERLSPGAFFVTFTKGLTSDEFELMERKRYKMSWGPATVFIHRRLNHDKTVFSNEQLQDVPDDDSYKEYDDTYESSDEDEEEDDEEKDLDLADYDDGEEEDGEDDQLEDLD